MNKKPPMEFAPAALVSVEKEKFLLWQDVNVIGRSENAFICLSDPMISRKHCVISRTENKEFTICDTSSSGTYVNSNRLVKNRIQILEHKDKISLGSQSKYTYTFFLNKAMLELSSHQNEQLNSQMREQILNLDTSHSMELEKLNKELSKIKSEKSELKEEMNSKLEAQVAMFNKEHERLSKLVTNTNEQQEKSEKELKQMKETLKAEKKKLTEELENKIANMNKKEEELQQIKIDMEIQHQKDRQQLEDKYKEEVFNLKLKLERSELEQGRLEEETREAKQQLAESKQILMDCEIEQARLANEKVEVESKLASTIIDLTKEKANVVRELETKIKETENKTKKMLEELNDLEEHLLCSICTELYIEPKVLDCGHMFCRTCIDEWTKKKKICPMCRCKIKGGIQIFTLDRIIEKHVALLSSEAKEHRDSIIKKRKNSPPKSAKNKKSKVSSSTRTTQTTRVPTQTQIPMVQATDYLNIVRREENLHRIRDEENLQDPFRWSSRRERTRAHTLSTPFVEWMVPTEAMVPVAAIDLTNMTGAPVHWRADNATPSTSTSTSTSGLIDLTTP